MQSIKEIVERLRNIEFEPVDVGSTGVAWTLKDPDVLDDIADALEALLAESGPAGVRSAGAHSTKEKETKMKLYLISQDQNDDYDTFDSAVVAAPDEETARNMHPADGELIEKVDSNFYSWCSGPEYVTVRYLGEADASVKQGVVCASFNAG